MKILNDYLQQLKDSFGRFCLSMSGEITIADKEAKDLLHLNDEDKQKIVIQQYPPVLFDDSTTIVQYTKIPSLPIQLVNPTFQGRFTRVTYTNAETTTIPIELPYTVESNIVRVTTESLDFSSLSDYIFTLEDPGNNAKSLVYTVKMVKGVDIKVNHFLIIYNSTSTPTIDITLSSEGITNIFIRENGRMNSLTKIGSVWRYFPLLNRT